MLSVAVRAFALLLLLLVLDDVLPDERLVLDENDEPSEMNEFGRCTAALEPSPMVVENELRSFGAVLQIKIFVMHLLYFYSTIGSS